MKKIYESKDGYKVYEHKILEYPIHISVTTSSGVLISVPMGETPEDKKMFDELVYFNKSVYHAKTRIEVIKKVRTWIINYKRG